MSEFIHHESCPNCGSKDNLGVWEDHKWCFGCGYYEGSKDRSLTQLRKLAIQGPKKTNNKESKNVFLPSDFTYSLPACAKEWLDNYGITDKEIIINHIGWSDAHERLYFPVFDLFGNLVMYQGRFLGQGYGSPRYSTRGRVDSVFHIIGNGSDTCVLVEDFISAIKVGREHLAMPLWGSQISLERIIALSDRFKGLVIWLDRDKAEYALKARLKASIFFDDVATIITDKDPKEYNNAEIRRFISQATQATT